MWDAEQSGENLRHFHSIYLKPVQIKLQLIAARKLTESLECGDLSPLFV